MYVTNHAVEKYRQITGSKQERIKVIMKILAIYKRSKREDTNSNPKLIERIINNGIQETAYYRYDRFRITVTNNAIVTIEENRYKGYNKQNINNYLKKKGKYLNRRNKRHEKFK